MYPLLHNFTIHERMFYIVCESLPIILHSNLFRNKFSFDCHAMPGVHRSNECRTRRYASRDLFPLSPRSVPIIHTHTQALGTRRTNLCSCCYYEWNENMRTLLPEDKLLFDFAFVGNVLVVLYVHIPRGKTNANIMQPISVVQPVTNGCSACNTR